MRTFVGDVPLSAAALAVVVVVALIFSRAVAERLRTRRAVSALLLVGFGLVLSATLTPAGLSLHEPAAARCDIARIGLAPIGELTRVTFTSLNVLLFVPLGLAIGLLPRGRPAAALTLAAAATPFLIEAVQLTVSVLGRNCQTADIFDNLLGLAIGIVMGTLARPLAAATQPRR